MKTISVELQPCLGKRSGIGTYIYEITKRLSNDPSLKIQGNVFNFCRKHDNREIYEDLGCPILENSRIPYSVFRLSQYTVPILYSRIFARTDVNLFFNYIIPEGVEGKVCVAIHDMSYLRFPDTLKKRNFLRLNYGIQRTVQQADRILTISEFSKKEITELLHISEDRISVIPCAAPMKRNGDSFSILAEKYGITKPYFLFVSTIEPRKNIVRLIRAFELVRKESNLSCQLVLAGGEGWNNDMIYKEVEKLTAKDDIIFTGYIADGEKTSLYENAECLVFPSLYEGFGIPPLEAMQYGCPVVCSSSASLPEIAGSAALFVDPYSVDSIAEGMIRLLSDHCLKTNLVKKGFEQVKKYSWDQSAEKLKEICKEL